MWKFNLTEHTNILFPHLWKKNSGVTQVQMVVYCANMRYLKQQTNVNSALWLVSPQYKLNNDASLKTGTGI